MKFKTPVCSPWKLHFGSRCLIFPETKRLTDFPLLWQVRAPYQWEEDLDSKLNWFGVPHPRLKECSWLIFGTGGMKGNFLNFRSRWAYLFWCKVYLPPVISKMYLSKEGTNRHPPSKGNHLRLFLHGSSADQHLSQQIISIVGQKTYPIYTWQIVFSKPFMQ